jgi:hypothetical protein
MLISFILPATDKDKVKTLEASLNQLGMPFELIPIYNSTSFFDAWRQGVAKAKGEYLCFTHQDTEYTAIPDIEKYLKGKVGMIGTAGSTVIHKDQPWWFSQERFHGSILSGQVFYKEADGNRISPFGPFSEVVILDGVCLITRKDTLLKVGIPKIDWGSWDFYDHIISLEYIKKGYKLQTVPIVMTHDSKGGDKRPSFFTDMERFKKEYLYKSWRI